MTPCLCSLTISTVAGEGIRLGKKRISSWDRKSCFGDRLFLYRQVENLKQGGEAARRWVQALSKLHGAVEGGASTSWLRWYPFLLGSQLDCTVSEAVSQQSKLCPSHTCVWMCTPVLQCCGCWSHCSALSVHLCAPCHAGLSHAAAADQMFPLVAQILAIPAYFMQPLFLPATPAQD